jgi:hypothetical protein
MLPCCRSSPQNSCLAGDILCTRCKAPLAAPLMLAACWFWNTMHTSIGAHLFDLLDNSTFFRSGYVGWQSHVTIPGCYGPLRPEWRAATCNYSNGLNSCPHSGVPVPRFLCLAASEPAARQHRARSSIGRDLVMWSAQVAAYVSATSWRL